MRGNDNHWLYQWCVVNIRLATFSDKDAIWQIIEPVIRAGETYALPLDWSRETALDYWFDAPHTVFVYEDNGAILGTYYITPNQKGGGASVANCGYMVAQNAMGKGVASAMCANSIEYARECNYFAIQFNFVVSTNFRAVKLWQKFGFEILATIPKAFNHPKLGKVDALLMYQIL